MLNRRSILTTVVAAALLQTGCYAQKQLVADSLTIQAKVWSKDEAKQVRYSDWKSYRAITIDKLPGFKPGNTRMDKYGGNAAVSVKATGFFRTEKLNNRWWVIDPEGHPVVVTAVNSIRPGKSVNNEGALIKNFGSVEKWISTTAAMLNDAGFNVAGSWSDTTSILTYNRTGPAKPLVYTTQLNLLSGYASIAKKQDKQRKGNSTIAFLLDDAFAAYCDVQVRKLGDIKNDPNLLGHFSDNELPFTHTAFDELLAVNDLENKCYQAALTWMKENGKEQSTMSRQDKEAFMGWLAGKYFEVVSKAIRQYDPNHLYIGSRVHSSAKSNPAIVRNAAAYMDIISINYYGDWQPTDKHLNDWATWSDKPYFITEFYTKAEETGMSNLSGAGWIVKTQEDRGIHYQNFCLRLLQDKNCVGWHWFRYQDNDPGDAAADESNKDSNKGIVTTEYKAYEPLLQKMKQLNLQRYSLTTFFDQRK